MHPTHLRFVAQILAERLNVDASKAEMALAEAMNEVEENSSISAPGHRTPDNEAERPKSYVRIPFLANAADAAPLSRVIATTADRAGESHYTAVILMTLFLEAICREVGEGNAVRIPGFGIFAPWLWDGRGDSSKAAVYPRFSAARPFRNEVSGVCPPQLAKNDVLRNFQRSHHPSSRPRGNSYSRTMTTMESFRAHINRQSAGHF